MTSTKLPHVLAPGWILILVKNSVLLDAFVGWCMDCDNVHGVSNIQFALTFLKVCLNLSLLTFLSLRSHAFRILRIPLYVTRFSVSGVAKERTVPSS